jgi:hypothetical protein
VKTNRQCLLVETEPFDIGCESDYSDPIHTAKITVLVEGNPYLWRLTLASASIQNVSKAFELSNADVGIERQKLGVSEVLRHWLGSDAVAASERVSRMPQGQLRDIATREIACWLRSKNCVEDADRWAESISDPAIKSEAFR